ncbi:hypothetical protein [Algoriphagus namhaensis]
MVPSLRDFESGRTGYSASVIEHRSPSIPHPAFNTGHPSSKKQIAALRSQGREN